MGPAHSEPSRYAAFISYSHADEVMAARLHRALEIYAVPRHLRAQGKATKPVFRDVAELTAAHSLTEKIREAVKGSRVLIVLCSPAAKASHWVNEEIRLFRKLHGEAAILPAIIDGTPETAFPKALTEGGREPLAAALGADRAGFKLGVTQLAAGMLGTGLDDLIQRGAKRRNRIMATGLAASLLFSGAMGFTAYQAVDARNAAQTARGEAEGLVEYMIKDLKFKLETVGRLDLLEGIGDKAVDYYDKQDIKNLPDESLNRQAAARQVLAQVHLDAGRMEEAQREIEASAALTREVRERNPDDTDAIFAHAQSEFWVGEFYNQQNKFDEVEKPWTEYNRLAQLLYQKNPQNVDWIMEAGWGASNLGKVSLRKNKFEMATAYLESALDIFKEAEALEHANMSVKAEIAHILGILSDAARYFGHVDKAISVRDAEIKFLRDHPDVDTNYGIKFDLAKAVFRRARLASRKHDYENADDDFEWVITRMEELTLHDHQNLEWQLMLLRAYVDYYFYTEAEDVKLQLTEKISALQALISERASDEFRLELFYADLTKYKRGLNDLSDIRKWTDRFPADRQENYFIQAELMRIDETDIMFPREVLRYSKSSFPKLTPIQLDHYVLANERLGACQEALRGLKVLKGRGYKIPKLTTCET
jgi:tetratricopeptide (TPR) repeat protein